MPVCKTCDNHKSYHLVPVIHPSSPDTVDHLCLDCLNKEIVKTGDISSKIVKESKDALDQFFRDLEAPLCAFKNVVGDYVQPFCSSCEKPVVFCQGIKKVSIANKIPKEPAIPVDDNGNAVALMCDDCIKLDKKPRFSFYKKKSDLTIVVVDVNELPDN